MTDAVWKNPAIARRFLRGVRGGIPFVAAQIEILIRIIQARGEPLGSVADLGCGDGILAAAILTRYPKASATLVDFSEPMMAQARARFRGRRSVRLVMADLGSPKWTRAVSDRAPFDLIVSGFAIHHQPDRRKKRLYGEIFSLLKPGGLFLNTEHVSSPTPWIESICDNLIIDSLHRFHQSQGSRKSRKQVADEFVHRPDKAANILAPVERQCGWLCRLGFQDVDCYFKVFEIAIFGGRRPPAPV